jgi:hypothetical protein
MGTGSRSLRSVPVPISPVLTRGVGNLGQARAEYVPSQSPFADRMKQPCPGKGNMFPTSKQTVKLEASAREDAAVTH